MERSLSETFSALIAILRMVKTDAVLEKSAPTHTFLERGDCPGESIGVGNDINALVVVVENRRTLVPTLVNACFAST